MVVDKEADTESDRGAPKGPCTPRGHTLPAKTVTMQTIAMSTVVPRTVQPTRTAARFSAKAAFAASPAAAFRRAKRFLYA